MNKTVFEEGHGDGNGEGAVNILLRQGRRRFGPPSVDVENQIRSIQDHARLKTLIERILDVHSWDELLNG